MKINLVGPLLVLVLTTSSVLSSQDCNCGPDYCLNDPRYQAKLTTKKKQMQNAGYPADLIALMDLDGACVARVDRAPDVFTIKLLYADGSSSTIPWTQQDEDLARKEILSGKLNAYYKFNVSRAFKCCGQPNYDQRPDWDSTLDLNRGLAIACTKNGATMQCQQRQ